MEPTVDAASVILEKLRADLHAGLTGLDSDALNWRPLPEANSIAGLVAHLLEASRFLLELGRGQTIPRDREAQFGQAAPDVGTLLARVDAGWEPLLAAVRAYSAGDLAATRQFRDRQVTGAWCLVHACEHATEHWGQIQLTRDLYAARNGGRG